MKKLIALFIALALCLGMASVAMAEEDIPSVSWIEKASDAAKHDGEFYTLEQVGLKFWIAANLEPIELGQAELDKNFIAAFGNEDQSNLLVITLDNSNRTYESAYNLVKDNGMECSKAMINNLPAIVYHYVRSDGSESDCVAFVTHSGRVLQFVFTGEDADFRTNSTFTMYSIQPEDTVLRPVFNWEDSEEALMNAGIDGSFYKLFNVNVLVWIPDFLAPNELSDEDREAGLIAYFTSEDGANYLAVTLTELDVDYAQGLALLEESGVENIREVIINGLSIVVYSYADDSGLTHTAAMLFTSDGYGLDFDFSAGDEAFDEFIDFILSSIQPD